MPSLDLTPFGFTPTEGIVYEVLLRGGAGTGYAIARTAGLARANAYGALEGLVQKGAARVEEGRPKRYRPEPPSALMARILERQGRALDDVTTVLDQLAVPATTTLVELGSGRAVLQLASREIARAAGEVLLHAPADAYPPLIPSLRKAAGSGVTLSLSAGGPVELPFAAVAVTPAAPHWPGEPFLLVVDGRSAILAAREGDQAAGHWGAAPTLVAAARASLERFRSGA